MSKNISKQGRLKNLNFLIDTYKYIPQNANANQQHFINVNLRKHTSLRLFQLTRFKPNNWVQQRQPLKIPTPYKELKSQQLDLQFKQTKYSSRPQIRQSIHQKKQKLQQELDKMSSLEVFDRQLRSSSYSRYQKRILQDVQKNAKKALTQRTFQSIQPTRKSPTRMSGHVNIVEYYDNLFNGGIAKTNTATPNRFRRRGGVISSMSGRSSRMTLN